MGRLRIGGWGVEPGSGGSNMYSDALMVAAAAFGLLLFLGVALQAVGVV